jgi:hypothetical protein
VAIRPILAILAASGRLPAPSLISSPIAGFLMAALAYSIMARVGLVRPATPIETFPVESGEFAALVQPGGGSGPSEPSP